VHRPSVQWILTLIRHGDLRQVGLAQDNRPGLTQPGHKWRILVSLAVGALCQSKCGWRPGQIEGFLDGDGQPVQRSEWRALGAAGIGLVGSALGILEARHHDGPELWVDCLDAFDVGIHDGACRNLARRQAADKVGGAHLNQWVFRLGKPFGHDFIPCSSSAAPTIIRLARNILRRWCCW
jgi:hypothetical protein